EHASGIGFRLGVEIGGATGYRRLAARHAGGVGDGCVEGMLLWLGRHGCVSSSMVLGSHRSERRSAVNQARVPCCHCVQSVASGVPPDTEITLYSVELGTAMGCGRNACVWSARAPHRP